MVLSKSKEKQKDGLSVHTGLCRGCSHSVSHIYFIVYFSVTAQGLLQSHHDCLTNANYCGKHYCVCHTWVRVYQAGYYD